MGVAEIQYAQDLFKILYILVTAYKEQTRPFTRGVMAWVQVR